MDGKEYSAWAVSLCIAASLVAIAYNLITYLISLI
jgi:hypothetical protein